MMQDHSRIRSATNEYRVPYLSEDNMQMSYLLSPQNRILDIGGDWDKFAWANDGFEATADFVIGRDLSDFVDGFETASFFNAIAFTCRRWDHSFEMISRCDGPERMNLFRMRIQPLQDQFLEISYALLMSRAFPEKSNPRAKRTRVDAARCSMCGGYRHGRLWMDSLADGNLDFHASHYVICPDCKARARAALQRARVPAERASGLIT